MTKMTLRITDLEALDLRFPPPGLRDGVRRLSARTDHSAAYVILHTTDPLLSGHGYVATEAPGTEVCIAAVTLLSPHVIGLDVDEVCADMGRFYRGLIEPTEFRWLGPEKGVMHLATAAVLNAVWDLFAKIRGVPLWKLLVDMTPEEIIRVVDFHYLTDALSPAEALAMLQKESGRKQEREVRAPRRWIACVYDVAAVSFVLG